VIPLKTKYWIILFSLMLALCLGLSFFATRTGAPASHARIKSGDSIVTVSLLEDQQFTVETGNGYNTVTVRDGKIAVTSADCPDQYCVRQGFCNRGVQIVCLPHDLVISFLNGDGIDGAVG
jgi:hypothetical protein